jgi:hypothetical protein
MNGLGAMGKRKTCTLTRNVTPIRSRQDHNLVAMLTEPYLLYLSILSIHLWYLKSFCWTLVAFSILILYTVGRTPWTGNQQIGRPLATHRTTQTQNKRTQTSMPWVGLEPTIPAFGRTKTVHVLDCVATLIGLKLNIWLKVFIGPQQWKWYLQRHDACSNWWTVEKIIQLRTELNEEHLVNIPH